MAPAAPWLITGANGLLTSAVAFRLHRGGTPLLLHVHERTHRIRDLLELHPSVRGDLATPGPRREVLAAVESHAPLGGLVLGASRFEPEPVSSTPPRALAATVERELVAHLEIVGALHRRLIDGARIVLFSDTGTALGWPSHPAYLAAKAGLEAATRSLARDLGPRLVVFCVAPGSLEGAPPPPEGVTRHRTALGRPGTPDEVARAVVAYSALPTTVIQGSCLVVDGGRRLYTS